MTDHITIYGASSPDIDPRFIEAARRVGELIAGRGVTLVSGGGRTGLMAAAIEGASVSSGATVGILPQFMIDRRWGHPDLGTTISTPDMHTRKRKMASLSGAVIALPGGVGTLEELLEIITWRQLGLYQGNIVILNTLGYYDPLLQMLERSIEMHFMNPDHRSLWQVAATPDEAVALALDKEPEHRSFTQKIH
ncbi:MAG: TIGR00730 family Rossman fold protein [Muribaculaceae bacterium]|nr:TIGR00730 family Rossman fold protein [Muribaculaceae bacterium]